MISLAALLAAVHISLAALHNDTSESLPHENILLSHSNILVLCLRAQGYNLQFVLNPGYIHCDMSGKFSCLQT